MKISQNLPGRLVLAMALVALALPVRSQDFPALYNNLKERIKNDPIRINGGISANVDFLSSSDSLRSQTPFNYRLSANLNIDLLGIRVPLSANISNAKVVYNYQLPAYSFVGLSPTYKWATLHVGDRSLNLSPYSLSGQSFFGVGTELQPGKLRLTALYGRLRKPIQEQITTDGTQGPEPSFQRMGWGLKAGWDGGPQGSYEIVLFHAKDDPFSIDSLTQSPTLKPMENLVVGFNTKRQLGRSFSLSVEYALSALTSDLLATGDEGLNGRRLFNFGGLLNTNLTTNFYNALKTSVGLQVSPTTTVQVNYERIDPGYRSLGALFFNDNMENYTASTNTNLLERRLTLSANLGVQRNNLDGTQVNSGIRFVGSLNASYRATDRLNLSAVYSNFRNTSIRDVSIESLQNSSTALVDTRLTSFITQVSQNANLSATYAAGAERKSNFSLLLSFQNANNIENQQVMLDQQTTYYTSALSYSYLLTGIDLTVSSSVMVNYGLIPQADILSLTPTLALTKSFMEKTLQANASFSLASAYTGDLLANRIFSGQAGLRFSKFKNHPLSFNLRFVQRAAIADNPAARALTEFSGVLTYNYRFTPQLKRGE